MPGPYSRARRVIRSRPPPPTLPPSLGEALEDRAARFEPFVPSRRFVKSFPGYLFKTGEQVGRAIDATSYASSRGRPWPPWASRSVRVSRTAMMDLTARAWLQVLVLTTVFLSSLVRRSRRCLSRWIRCPLVRLIPLWVARFSVGALVPIHSRCGCSLGVCDSLVPVVVFAYPA